MMMVVMLKLMLTLTLIVILILILLLMTTLMLTLMVMLLLMMMLTMVVIILMLVLVIERKAIMTNEYRPSRYVSRVAIDRATVLSLEPTIDISHIWDEELNLENQITSEIFFGDIFCPPYEGVNVSSVDKIRDVLVQVHR